MFRTLARPARFVLTTLALSVAMLPVVAFAVELPGEVVEAVAQEARIDHSAAWEAHLREQRARRVEDLRAYSEAGVFPRKPGEPGWHHQFLDADGNPCAVASLIMTSGHADLVVQMAATDNAVVVSELEHGPIVDWVLTSGLTMEEIAVIQVPGWEPDIVELQPREAPIAQPDRKEQRRIRRHLAATLDLIEADTEASIWKAVTRLGDKRFEAPPRRRPSG